MGRKPIPVALKRDRRLAVMLTDSEMEALEACAADAGAESLSAWVRDILLREALKGSS